MSIIPATIEDVKELISHVENSYSGEASKHGSGVNDKTPIMEAKFRVAGSKILKYLDANGTLLACVHTEKFEDTIFVGMLCVRRDIQGGGIGKKMMAAVEALAEEYKCSRLKLEVVWYAKELMEWYERVGFQKTGRNSRLPHWTGDPAVPVEFVVMVKELPAVAV